MHALLFILTCIAVLTGLFAVIIRQMAEVRRRRYRDELLMDRFLSARERRAERAARHRRACNRRISFLVKPSLRLVRRSISSRMGEGSSLSGKKIWWS